MVVFARNARKWNHADGGYLHSFQEGGILVNPFAPNYSVPFTTDMNNAQQVAQDSTAVQAIPVSKYKELEDIADRQRYLESGYKDDAVSKAGARGAFQVVPNTQKH